MNDLVLELCERESYVETLKLTPKEIKTRDPLRRLNNFISYKKKKNKARFIESKRMLSFEVLKTLLNCLLNHYSDQY